MTLYKIEYDESRHSISCYKNSEVLKKDGWDEDHYNAALLETFATAIGELIKENYKTPQLRVKVLNCINQISRNIISVN